MAKDGADDGHRNGTMLERVKRTDLGEERLPSVRQGPVRLLEQLRDLDM